MGHTDVGGTTAPPSPMTGMQQRIWRRPVPGFLEGLLVTIRCSNQDAEQRRWTGIKLARCRWSMWRYCHTQKIFAEAPILSELFD